MMHLRPIADEQTIENPNLCAAIPKQTVEVPLIKASFDQCYKYVLSIMNREDHVANLTYMGQNNASSNCLFLNTTDVKFDLKEMVQSDCASSRIVEVTIEKRMFSNITWWKKKVTLKHRKLVFRFPQYMVSRRVKHESYATEMTKSETKDKCIDGEDANLLKILNIKDKNQCYSLTSGGITIAPLAEATKSCKTRKTDEVDVTMKLIAYESCTYKQSRYSKPSPVNETSCYKIDPVESKNWPYPLNPEPKCFFKSYYDEENMPNSRYITCTTTPDSTLKQDTTKTTVKTEKCLVVTPLIDEEERNDIDVKVQTQICTSVTSHDSSLP